MLKATMRWGCIRPGEGLGKRHTDENVWGCSKVDGSIVARYLAYALETPLYHRW